MVNNPIAVPTRLVSQARTAFSFGDSADARESGSDIDRNQRTKRSYSPQTTTLDGEEFADDFEGFDGAIGLLRADADSEIVDEFERAVLDSNPDQLRRIHERLESAAQTETDDATVVDLTYYGEPVISGLGRDADSSVVADFAAFNGGDLDCDAFEVHEYADGNETDYEYQVIVIDPVKSEAEKDAAALAPKDVEKPSLNVRPSESSAVCLVAAGAVLGAAAVYSSGSADNAITELDSGGIADIEDGASVDELVAAREQLHG